MKTGLEAARVREILKGGERIVHGPLTLVYKNKKNHSLQRTAIVISKRNIRKAVERNKLRRKLRGALKEVKFPISEFILMYNTKDKLAYKDMVQTLKELVAGM